MWLNIAEKLFKVTESIQFSSVIFRVISPPFSTPLHMFLYNQFLFYLLHFIPCRMCVCHMFNKVLTYLLSDKHHYKDHYSVKCTVR